MHCYNDDCKYKYVAGPPDEDGQPTDLGLHMPKERPHTAFCSDACKVKYWDGQTSVVDAPKRRLSVSEVQEKLKDMAAQSAGKLNLQVEDKDVV